MTDRHFIMATAGHIDHGKSALVKALTGTDPDRLPEEKARGITIDLGFAFLELPEPGSQASDKLQIGIVDVPGHEDFVKNMLAGVGSVDLALLVVAADDRWMPQTEEHLQILSYLGVKQAVIALTKIDLATQREDQVEQAVREALRESPFFNAPIVRTSVVNGRGLPELRETIREVLAQTPPPPDLSKPRLPVDRVFTLHGIGTVVTGTLTGGILRRGQEIIVQPSGKKGRIRSIQSHNREVEMAVPGTRTALNIPALSGSELESDLRRGSVITLEGLGRAIKTADVLLERTARGMVRTGETPRPLKNGSLVRIHSGTSTTAGRLLFLDKVALFPGEHQIAQVRFESDVFLFVGDRFIVRDWAEQKTLAGGVVLEVGSSPRNFRTEPQRKFLHARAKSPENLEAFGQSQIERDRAVRRSALLVQSRFSVQEVSAAVEALLLNGCVIKADPWIVDPVWWSGLQEKAVGLIRAKHQRQSHIPAMPLNELRSALQDQLPVTEHFELLVLELCQSSFLVESGGIRDKGHKAALPPQLQAAGEKIRSILSTKPLDPPSRKELAPDLSTQQALRYFLQTGEAVEVASDLILSREAYNQAIKTIRRVIAEQGPATVSELRQVLSTSRRVMVPLLEKLDREGVTLRQGDKRVLR